MSGAASNPGSKSSKKDVAVRCSTVPILGILYAIAGSVFFGITLVFARMSGVFPLMVLFQRSILQFQCFLCAVVFSGERNLGIKDRKKFVLSVVCATFGGAIPVFCYLAVFYIPAADTITIFFSSPVFVTLYTCITTRKNPGLLQLLVVGLTISGVIIVMKPAFIFGTDEKSSDMSWLEGCLLALGSSLSFSAFCLTCNLCKGVSSVSLNFLVSAISLLITVLVLCGLNNYTFPACGTETVYTMLSVITGILGAFLLVLASKREKAGPVAIASTAQLPVVIVLQIAVTKELPYWNSYLGSSFIIISVLISGWLRWRQENASSTVENKQLPKDERDSLNLSLMEETKV